MSRTVARSVVSLLLVAAAVMFVVAAGQRWLPACSPGAFETAACLALQSHEYDYLLASDPWTPLGHAAQYAGVALLLLAAAGAVLPFVLLRRPVWLQTAVAVAVAASLTVLGLHAWTSGVTGLAQPAPAPVAMLVWSVVVPGLLVVWAARESRGEPAGRQRVWTVAFAAASIASTPVPVALLGPLLVGYGSHDTAPWSDAVIAVPLVVAGALVWGVVPRTRPPRTSAAARHEVLTSRP